VIDYLLDKENGGGMSTASDVAVSGTSAGGLVRCASHSSSQASLTTTWHPPLQGAWYGARFPLEALPCVWLMTVLLGVRLPFDIVNYVETRKLVCLYLNIDACF
jgi:hypothetical protein